MHYNSISLSNTIQLKHANSNNSYFDSSFVICWDNFGCHQFTQQPMFHVYLFLQKVMFALKDTSKRLFARHILNREMKQNVITRFLC